MEEWHIIPGYKKLLLTLLSFYILDQREDKQLKNAVILLPQG